MSAKPSVTLHDLTFEWPDGKPALSGVNGTFTTGRTGLIGRNGSGKSTLLRLIAGRLVPTGGRVDAVGEVGHLPQTLTFDQDTSIAGLLGIDSVLAAIRAVESGDADGRHFDVIGDDWDVEARAEEALHQIGFTAADLDRRVVEVSGGEAMLIAVTGLRLRRTPITLLDEPTNNLDLTSVEQLAEALDAYHGGLLVVSHDRAFLGQIGTDTALELGADGRLGVV